VVERASAGAVVDFIPGNGGFIGTKLKAGTDEEQRADAKREYQYQKIIDAVETSGVVQGQNVGDVWTDADDYWRAATGGNNGIGLVKSQGHPALISTRAARRRSGHWRATGTGGLTLR
jgi:hypothetical protein